MWKRAIASKIEKKGCSFPIWFKHSMNNAEKILIDIPTVQVCIRTKSYDALNVVKLFVP